TLLVELDLRLPTVVSGVGERELDRRARRGTRPHAPGEDVVAVLEDVSGHGNGLADGGLGRERAGGGAGVHVIDHDAAEHPSSLPDRRVSETRWPTLTTSRAPADGCRAVSRHPAAGVTRRVRSVAEGNSPSTLHGTAGCPGFGWHHGDGWPSDPR